MTPVSAHGIAGVSDVTPAAARTYAKSGSFQRGLVRAFSSRIPYLQEIDVHNRPLGRKREVKASPR